MKENIQMEGRPEKSAGVEVSEMCNCADAYYVQLIHIEQKRWGQSVHVENNALLRNSQSMNSFCTQCLQRGGAD